MKQLAELCRRRLNSGKGYELPKQQAAPPAAAGAGAGQGRGATPDAAGAESEPERQRSPTSSLDAESLPADEAGAQQHSGTPDLAAAPRSGTPDLALGGDLMLEEGGLCPEASSMPPPAAAVAGAVPSSARWQGSLRFGGDSIPVSGSWAWPDGAAACSAVLPAGCRCAALLPQAPSCPATAPGCSCANTTPSAAGWPSA